MFINFVHGILFFFSLFFFFLLLIFFSFLQHTKANANGMFTHEINSNSVWENECHEEENKNEQLKLVLCCRNNSPKDAP